MPSVRGGGAAGAEDTDDTGPLDPHDADPPSWAYKPAADVVQGLLETDSGVRGAWRWRRRPASPPVVEVKDRFLTGVLPLRATEFPYLLRFERCRFEYPPDVRQAKLLGLIFEDCWLPGLMARNLLSSNDVRLINTTVEVSGVDFPGEDTNRVGDGGLDSAVNLADGTIEGSLVFTGSTVENPASKAIRADRLSVQGAVIAYRLRALGEIRVPGMRTGGNVNLSGAVLVNPGGLTVNGNGLHVGGNLLCETDVTTAQRFYSEGRLFLPSARVDSDMVLRGAELHPGGIIAADADDLDDPHFDPTAALYADRMRVGGNVELDNGMRSFGTLRMLNAFIGGSLQLSGSEVKVPRGMHRPWQDRALHLDGTEVSGDLDARLLRITGQARMADMVIGGDVLAPDATLVHPMRDVFTARRSKIGGNLSLAGSQLQGTLQLQGVEVGGNVDLRGCEFTSARRSRARSSSVDIRTARIGRDFICAKGEHSDFLAQGGVSMDGAEVTRKVNFHEARLRSSLGSTALYAQDVRTQDMILSVAAPPIGEINLRQASCTSFADNPHFWSATGGINLEDFRYDALAKPLELKADKELRTRLGWLYKAMRGRYRPGPYDQFATMLRASGNEEHAATVLIKKQKERYSALARGYRVLGPGVRVWSFLQRSMVGYGYRPTRALAWLLVCLFAGSVWFGLRPPLEEINSDDTLSWNPVLFTVDLLVPIVDFGNKNRWQVIGVDQWISTGLIATGWVLATTIAAGVTRMLRRNA